MVVKLRPLGDRVVIEPLEREERTESGLYIPETAKEKPQQGVILAVGQGRRDESGARIAMDVQEVDNAYLVAAELPGVQKEDIDISISGNQVTITAEAKEEKVSGGAKEWCKERRYGKYSRTLQLPIEVEEKGADAQYANGVLRLTLPKKTSGMAKKLEVH